MTYLNSSNTMTIKLPIDVVCLILKYRNYCYHGMYSYFYEDVFTYTKKECCNMNLCPKCIINHRDCCHVDIDGVLLSLTNKLICRKCSEVNYFP